MSGEFSEAQTLRSPVHTDVGKFFLALVLGAQKQLQELLLTAGIDSAFEDTIPLGNCAVGVSGSLKIKGVDVAHVLFVVTAALGHPQKLPSILQ